MLDMLPSAKPRWDNVGFVLWVNHFTAAQFREAAMKRSVSSHVIGALVGLIAASVVMAILSARGGESPATKPTAGVPVEDLANQLHLSVARLDELLAKPDEFDDAR